MTRKPLTAVAAVLMMLAAGVSDAQRFSDNVEVTVIEVPVIAVDRDGKAVRGLTRENFEIYDEGKRVPIEYFDVVDLTAVRSATPSQQRALPPAAYRNFLLLFDLAYSSPGTIGRSQAAAREFVNAKLERRDLVAVAVYSAAHGLKLLTNFTADRAATTAAIDAVTASSSFKPGDPLLLSADVTARGGSVTEDINAPNRPLSDDEMRSRLRTQLSNFGDVARALDRIRGQKQVVLLSEGFDPRLIVGRVDLSFDATRQENAAAASGEIWRVDSDRRFSSTSSQREIDDMVQLFRRSDVRMHAIDIKGLRGDVDARDGLKRTSNEALYLLTRPTGGTVFRNASDLGDNFESLLRQQEVIYVLGFSAKSTAKKAEFRNLRVRTNARGVELTHRGGYYEPAALNEMEQTLSLAEILVKDDEVEDVPLSVAAAVTPGPELDIARVPVVIEIPGAQLIDGARAKSITANLFVYAFDERQQVRDYMQQRIDLDLSKTRDQLTATGIRYIGALRLPPGQYDVKALVRVDQTGKTGMRRTAVRVPEFDDKAVLAPMAVSESASAQWITLVNPQRGNEAAAVLSLGETPFVPQARTAMAPAAQQRVALMLYRMPADGLTVTPTIVFADGTTQDAVVDLVGRTNADSQGVSKLVFNFKPQGLQKGQYALRFTVTPIGESPSVVALPFAIQ